MWSPELWVTFVSFLSELILDLTEVKEESEELIEVEEDHQYQRPQKVITGEKSLSRSQTESDFSQKRTGAKQTPFICPQCGSVSQVNLKSHIKIYTGERDFTCLQCGSSFFKNASSRNLKRRLQTHTGEKRMLVDLISSPGFSGGRRARAFSGVLEDETETVGVEPHKLNQGQEYLPDVEGLRTPFPQSEHSIGGSKHMKNKSFALFQENSYSSFLRVHSFHSLLRFTCMYSALHKNGHYEQFLRGFTTSTETVKGCSAHQFLLKVFLRSFTALDLPQQMGDCSGTCREFLQGFKCKNGAI
ncbi:Gastrula zinc finger protein XlCGF57.1 [Anabarilius grahami]|uniref:Gastrula zinc finger protein XlCGF57.1 n=1 Tax=Anabarilius grahami TaxID=495550 RepID=A0A3N0XRC1_ANAGA|nr:Gastrula zinc finger protein XlCGF57.1 [Anabarilius grahami]